MQGRHLSRWRIGGLPGVGVMAGIAGLATLLLFGWSEIGAGTVSATEQRADPSSLAAAPRIETQAERMEAIRRRGLELLRADIPEDEPSQSLARGDRLEAPRTGPSKPVMRIATAGEDNSVAATRSVAGTACCEQTCQSKGEACRERASSAACFKQSPAIEPGWHRPGTCRSRPSRRSPQPPDCRPTGRRRRRTSRSAGSSGFRSQAVGKICGRKEMAVEIRPATRL